MIEKHESKYAHVIVFVIGPTGLHYISMDADEPHHLKAENISLSASSFTIEFWALRKETNVLQTVISHGLSLENNEKLTISFSSSNELICDFGNNVLSSFSLEDTNKW